MARLDNFNPDTVPESEGGEFDLLPDGLYTIQIIESDLVAAKTGTGQVLNLTAEIIEGPRAGRKLWDRLNIVNANAQAQEIAQRALKHICQAIGHQGVLTDSEQLHFKPLRARVGHEDAKDGYKAKNVIKSYSALTGARPTGGASPSTPAQAAQSTQPHSEPQRAAASGGGGARPWR